ncbi:MAG: S-methyl-5-thioribose-1-phosphate isomerase, partial [Candidatus Methanomethylicota archaeon]
MFPKTIEWMDGVVKLIDQTKLPSKLEFIECRTVERIAKAIKNMEVRGAPAIGAAAAFALALAAHHSKSLSINDLILEIKRAAEIIRETRPTARNLFWAIERILRKIEGFSGEINE